MTTHAASDFLRINEWGIKRIYGYPRDGINGIMGALDRANGAVDYIQVCHEDGGVHGLRSRQVHGGSRHLSRDLGPLEPFTC